MFTTTAIGNYFAPLTLIHANSLHSADLARDKNIVFNFSDAGLFGHPVYFDYGFRLFIPRFECGKVREML